MSQLLLFPDAPPSDGRAALLEPGEQDALIEFLLRGASPAIACDKLGIALDRYLRTADDDAGFRRRLRQVREVLTLNVVSSVYSACLKGTAAAQTLWLRTFAPPDWSEAADEPPSETDLSAEFDDALQDLSEDAIELQLRAYRAAGLPGPAA
jgi:hypothetical protein